MDKNYLDSSLLHQDVLNDCLIKILENEKLKIYELFEERSSINFRPCNIIPIVN